MTGSTGKEAAMLHHHESAVAQCDFSLTSDLLVRKSINSNSVCNMLPLTMGATESLTLGLLKELKYISQRWLQSASKKKKVSSGRNNKNMTHCTAAESLKFHLRHLVLALCQLPAALKIIFLDPYKEVAGTRGVKL